MRNVGIKRLFERISLLHSKSFPNGCAPDTGYECNPEKDVCEHYDSVFQAVFGAPLSELESNMLKEISSRDKNEP